MPAIDIVCPSGLSGTVRGLEGEELDLFANKQEIARRRVSRQVLASCWVETSELGRAYEGRIDADKKLDFNKVLMCDRFYALLMIRVATHGSKYDFRYQCSAETCRKRFEWRIDILDDLKVYELPEKSIAEFRGDNSFETEIGGEEITFKLMTGADEDTAVKARDLAPDMLATTSVIQRVTRVKQADGEVLTDGNDLRKWAKRLGFGNTMALVDEMDVVDGGTETDIEVQCQHCGRLEDISLPLEEDFWSPRRRGQSGKRKVRQKSQE